MHLSVLENCSESIKTIFHLDYECKVFDREFNVLSNFVSMQIIAIIIEGKTDGSSRRRGYRKLETNVEEAMPSLKSANSTYVY